VNDHVARRRIWLEVLLLYFLTCGLIRGIRVAKEGLGLSENWLVLVPIVFIYAPVLAERWNAYRVDDDIQFPEPLGPALLAASKWLLLLVALIYPAFVIGNHYWQTTGLPYVTRELLELKFPYPPHFPRHGLPDDLWLQIPYQLLCVGFAEEYFYRGYMQTRLDHVFDGRRFRVLGAEFGWALPVTAVLFTAGHSLVTWQWWQPFIIFPAFIFGWLRARTGNVLAGTLFHAWSNLAMIVLDSIYGVRG
jgi:membrane protease YdiL (CAAX protease family)